VSACQGHDRNKAFIIIFEIVIVYLCAFNVNAWLMSNGFAVSRYFDLMKSSFAAHYAREGGQKEIRSTTTIFSMTVAEPMRLHGQMYRQGQVRVRSNQ